MGALPNGKPAATADTKDDPRIKTSGLQSSTNKLLGRSIQVISFRWLSPWEV